MILKDLINTQAVTAKPDLSVAEAVHIMEVHNARNVVVVDNGRPMGLLNDREVALAVVNKGINPKTTPVRKLMTENFSVLKDDAPLREVLEGLKTKPHRRYPVIGADGKVVGVFALDDLLSHLEKDIPAVISFFEKTETSKKSETPTASATKSAVEATPVKQFTKVPTSTSGKADTVKPASAIPTQGVSPLPTQNLGAASGGSSSNPPKPAA